MFWSPSVCCRSPSLDRSASRLCCQLPQQVLKSVNRGSKLVQIPDLCELTQKVHLLLVPKSPNQELLWDILGVACLISSQLLLVRDVIVPWRLCPVKEPALKRGGGSHHSISVTA